MEFVAQIYRIDLWEKQKNYWVSNWKLAKKDIDGEYDILELTDVKPRLSQRIKNFFITMVREHVYQIDEIPLFLPIFLPVKRPHSFMKGDIVAVNLDIRGKA